LSYEFHLLFLWLPDADMAVCRVADRVRSGGHHVPEETIRRRYESGLSNFFKLYRPMTTTWQMLDGSRAMKPRPMASGEGDRVQAVDDPDVWTLIERRYGP
jgi:predicted ABC-type ATPase